MEPTVKVKTELSPQQNKVFRGRPRMEGRKLNTAASSPAWDCFLQRTEVARLVKEKDKQQAPGFPVFTPQAAVSLSSAQITQLSIMNVPD